MANGPPGSPGTRSGPSRGSGPNAGKGKNAALGARSKSSERSKSRSKQRGVNTAYSGNPAGGSSTQKKGSVMRESTWNNMSKGDRMKQYGTTSYAKYKAGKSRSEARGTARTNRQMRG